MKATGVEGDTGEGHENHGNALNMFPATFKFWQPHFLCQSQEKAKWLKDS